ncbi:MAG: hypothetical protein IJW76_06380 [Clostridia bacterium]|nr:hypothetical protein [Clostridia bacterium]
MQRANFFHFEISGVVPRNFYEWASENSCGEPPRHISTPHKQSDKTARFFASFAATFLSNKEKREYNYFKNRF